MLEPTRRFLGRLARLPLRLVIHLLRRTGKLFVRWADRTLYLDNRQLRDDNDRLRHQVTILEESLKLQVEIIARERERVAAETAQFSRQIATSTTFKEP